MRLEKRVDVPVYDLSLIRGMWEVREKKYRQRQRKEEERVEQSALVKINQQWQYRIQCRALKSREVTLLHQYLERSALQDIQPYWEPGTDPTQLVEESKFIFQLEGEKWMEFPKDLQVMTYLKEWHVRGTRIPRLPEYMVEFQDLTVLEIPKNCIMELPAEIGKLTQLRELNVNYNNLSRVPAELGDCENLERLELTGNRNLSELPFELSRLKKLKHLDLAENQFCSISICVLRMSSLQLLDLSNNKLTDLPQDIDRLEELNTLFIHKNNLSYLPIALGNITTLKMIVVSADKMYSYPSALRENPCVKFIRLFDNPLGELEDKVEDSRQGGHDKEFIETYIDTLKDRDIAPYSTTKVTLSCLL